MPPKPTELDIEADAMVVQILPNMIGEIRTDFFWGNVKEYGPDVPREIQGGEEKILVSRNFRNPLGEDIQAPVNENNEIIVYVEEILCIGGYPD